MRFLKLSTFISILVFLLNLAFPEVIALKNGEVIKGKLISQKNGIITFENKGQKLKFKIEEVSFIEFLSDKVVEIKVNGKTIKGVEIGMKDGKAIVKTAIGQKEVETTNVKEIKDEDNLNTTNIIVLTNIISITNYIEITNKTPSEVSQEQEEKTNNLELNESISTTTKTREITSSIYLENGIILLKHSSTHLVNLNFESSYKNILGSLNFGKAGDIFTFDIGIGYKILENLFLKNTDLNIFLKLGTMKDNFTSVPYISPECQVSTKYNFLKLYISIKTYLKINRELIISSSLGIGI